MVNKKLSDFVRTRTLVCGTNYRTSRDCFNIKFDNLIPIATKI